jgi:hypothetical protein
MDGQIYVDVLPEFIDVFPFSLLFNVTFYTYYHRYYHYSYTYTKLFFLFSQVLYVNGALCAHGYTPTEEEDEEKMRYGDDGSSYI